jgi:hypothetical protein
MPMLRRFSILAMAMLATGCDPQAGSAPDPAATPTPSASAAATATPTEGARERNGARSVSEETDDFLFEYAYPSAAGNIDALGDLLDARMEKVRTDLATSSAQARRQARDDGFPYNKHSYQGAWEVVAELPGFLSLSHEFAVYSGGAHGNQGMISLVWDKTANRAMEAVDLFTTPAALGEALGDRYCDALDAERTKKGIDLPGDDSVFAQCPGMEELTVLVGSSNRRHFNRLSLYAGPYVAGSYAEGAYVVDLGVDKAVLAAVKPEYQDAFRARN